MQQIINNYQNFCIFIEVFHLFSSVLSEVTSWNKLIKNGLIFIYKIFIGFTHLFPLMLSHLISRQDSLSIERMLCYYSTLKRDSSSGKRSFKSSLKRFTRKMTEIKCLLVLVILCSSFIKWTVNLWHFLGFALSTLPKLQKHKETSCSKISRSHSAILTEARY